MSQLVSSHNEILAGKAFGAQSLVFDELYSEDTIIRYKRRRVREHMNRLLNPASTILELNAGTGEDAVYFARQGHAVHATDISDGMMNVLQKKLADSDKPLHVSYEICAFTNLAQLVNRGPYDHIFSNFAGLNCTERLDTVLDSLSLLLKPGGCITLVVLPGFCLWEFLLLFKGKLTTAFRRFTGKKGASAHVEGTCFRCWYYNPTYVHKRLGPEFRLLAVEGLCTIVPPSYLVGFAEKRPRLYRFLCRMEERWKYSWPWRSIGDYYIISLQRK